VRDGGCVGLFGYPESRGPAPFPVHEAFRKSVRVEFVAGAQHEPGLLSFREAVAAVADGAIDVTPWLGTVYPLDELPDAFAHAQSRSGVIKVNISLAAG
jgi:L-iditol 2-dehydrogenase